MRNKNEKMITAAMLLAVAIVVQFLGRNIPQVNQFLVGPIVNAVLLLTTVYCGMKWGIITGALTPIMAYLVGQLLPPMAPFIPFIMIGNILYVVAFGILSQHQYGNYVGVGAGAFIKYLFLAFSATKIIQWIDIGLPPKVVEKLGIMMGVPQLVTGLVGGIVAIIFVWMLGRRKVR